MQTTKIKIEGMSCLNCATHIEKALEAVPGVKEVDVELEEGATVKHDGADPQQLLRAIQAAGSYRGELIREKAASVPS